MEKANKNFILVGIVALVAIVAIVVLISGNKSASMETSYGEANLAGEASKGYFKVNKVKTSDVIFCSISVENYDPMRPGSIIWDTSGTWRDGYYHSSDRCYSSSKMIEYSCDSSTRMRQTDISCYYGCADTPSGDYCKYPSAS